jgi:hypothetical protein
VAKEKQTTTRDEFLAALDGCLSDCGEDAGETVLCTLQGVVSRLRNKRQAVRGKGVACGPDGEHDHAACCHAALEASMETTALLLHLTCCAEDDY